MGCAMKKQRGVSLIAAVFIIVILGFMGVVFVSLINTSTLSSVNDLQSAQALSLAEGGVEYSQFALAQNLDWYRSTADPMPAPVSTTLPLGTGSFTVSANLPATKLSRQLRTGDATARVYLNPLPGRFPTAGVLQIEDKIGGGAEFVSYNNVVGNTFTISGHNQTISGITGSLVNHPRGSAVYPVTTLSTALAALGSPCGPTPAASFDIVWNSKFLSAGIIDIEGEEISYSGSTVTAGVMTLNGVIRCTNALAATTTGHPTGRPVTPVLIGGDTASYLSEITSTGSVGAAARIVRKTVDR